MKKQLLAIAILSSSIVSAQTWSEDFSSTTAPGLPVGWSQNNVDGLTVSNSLSSYNFGTNAWVSRDVTSGFPNNAEVVASTSWYSPAGVSNDWLITPSFTVPANAVIDWDAVALDPNYPDGYRVKISTTGTAVADFSTNLLTVNQENGSWTNRSVNLNAYAGQVVYIAFVNTSNDKYILFLDNIRVSVPPANDGNVVSINGLNRYMAGAGNQNITGSFKSMGYTAANTAVLNYNINNGSTITQTITFGTALNYGQTTNYSFTTPANIALGVNKIKTWVTHVNGIAETNLANDTAYSVVYVASQPAPRNVLIEEWSSSTCVPCANLNVNFDPLVNSNNPNQGGDVNIIKYQVNWPAPGNDPSYNAHCLSRRAHYDVNAAPTTIINGTSEMASHSQGEIDAAKSDDAFAVISATVSATKNSTLASGTTSVVASATITPYLTITSNSPLRVFQAILQSSYHYTTNTTTQKDFFHVMRKMSPNGWGSPITVTDGVPVVVNFTHLATAARIDPTTDNTTNPKTFNSWTTPDMGPTDIIYEYVVFVQDTISNDIIQSSSWTTSVSVPATVGLKELTNNNQISIYPNPAKEFAIVSLDLEKSASVVLSIYDITGKLVYTSKDANLDPGKHDIKINTAEFASGTYNVVVNANGGLLKEKLLISK